MNPSNTLPKIGDRVRVRIPASRFDGMRGTIVDQAPGRQSQILLVGLNDGRDAVFHPEDLVPLNPLSAPARMLLAAWHASGRTLERVNVHTSNEWLARRYCTPDRTVDLTITLGIRS